MDASELIPGAVIVYKNGNTFSNGKTTARVTSVQDDENVWLDTGLFLSTRFAVENCYLVQSGSPGQYILNVEDLYIKSSDGDMAVVDSTKPNPDSAGGLLQEAAVLIGQRGASRDGSGNERSMARTVSTFNTMTGHNLTEEDGWLFMRYLKDARSRNGEFNRDDYEDGIAYAALQAEAAINA